MLEIFNLSGQPNAEFGLIHPWREEFAHAVKLFASRSCRNEILKQTCSLGVSKQASTSGRMHPVSASFVTLSCLFRLYLFLPDFSHYTYLSRLTFPITHTFSCPTFPARFPVCSAPPARCSHQPLFFCFFFRTHRFVASVSEPKRE